MVVLTDILLRSVADLRLDSVRGWGKDSAGIPSHPLPTRFPQKAAYCASFAPHVAEESRAHLLVELESTALLTVSTSAQVLSGRAQRERSTYGYGGRGDDTANGAIASVNPEYLKLEMQGEGHSRPEFLGMGNTAGIVAGLNHAPETAAHRAADVDLLERDEGAAQTTEAAAETVPAGSVGVKGLLGRLGRKNQDADRAHRDFSLNDVVLVLPKKRLELFLRDLSREQEVVAWELPQGDDLRATLARYCRSATDLLAKVADFGVIGITVADQFYVVRVDMLCTA